MISKFIEYGSGEFLLRNRPNGGSAVLLRSVFITALAYSLAIGIRSYTADHSTFAFSRVELFREINETLPWLGAIFAGSYAALYARFSSQWNYLASLYNQLMAVSVTIPEADGKANKTLVNWRAAFIEDALDLHLATKPMFATAIHAMLQEPDVRASLVMYTAGGLARVQALEAKLRVQFPDVTPPHPPTTGDAARPQAA